MTNSVHSTKKRAQDWLAACLRLGPGEEPFPWQLRLLDQMAAGELVSAVDLPTGLGKTSVMAIWLVARALGGALPRRLAYVVDRRAVVDQATEVAEHLCDVVAGDPAFAAALGVPELFVSTLRGQHVDNRRWLDDPSLPAIIVGTVDMIGSRLLFSGYGVSPKMRPYQAGFLGADTLFVLDEAHLVPPFEHLLEAVTRREGTGPEIAELGPLIPRTHLTSLSATGRSKTDRTFSLNDDDLRHPVVRERLHARKRLTFAPVTSDEKLPERLAAEVWALTDEGKAPVRCLVFAHSREVAIAAKAVFERLSRNSAHADLFIGMRRVHERQRAAEHLKELGFIAGNERSLTVPAIIFATSAAEVGVDLDADHMVCDLVPWERMIQRLGRVNRRGKGKAEVRVVFDPEAVAAIEGGMKRKNVLRRAIESLPESGGAFDASPAALVGLKAKAREDPELRQVLDNATTPPPLRPGLAPAVVQAWAMTSLLRHTGRPEVAPWLRGWVDDEPQTQVAWRTHLPVRRSGAGGINEASKREVESFFEAAPPHTSEILEAPTHIVVGWLEARADEIATRSMPAAADRSETDSAESEPAAFDEGEALAFVLAQDGGLKRSLSLRDLRWEKASAARRREGLQRELVGSILIVDARLGGLDPDGSLDETATVMPVAADTDTAWRELLGFRVRELSDGSDAQDPDWRVRYRMPSRLNASEETETWLVVEKWRTNSANEDDRSEGPPQPLDEHEAWTAGEAQRIAQRLGLPPPYQRMLERAAALHDEGKRSARWQKAFNAPPGATYAKTEGPIQYALLDGYRHELGSFLRVIGDDQLRELPEDLRDLALHLIVSHHGYGRPLIGTSGCDDAPPSLVEERAAEIALRFVRMQRRWGPWGLAWWESLLRAADQQASRRNQREGAGKTLRKERSNG